MAEVAPFSNNFATNNGNDRHINSDYGSKYARALRKLAVALSLSTLTVLVAVLIILISFPFRYKGGAKHDTIFFVEWMSAIAVVCFIFALGKVPSLLKVIADFTFTWAIISCLVDFMNDFPHYEWCYNWGSTTPVHPRCVQWRLNVTILMGIASGFAIILGAIFVLLLIRRIYVIMRSQAWNQASVRWPTGEISWTVSLKFKRHDAEGSNEEANLAPTGQGPIHI